MYICIYIYYTWKTFPEIFVCTHVHMYIVLLFGILYPLSIYTYIHMYIYICSYVCYTVVWYIIPSIYLYVYTYVHIHMYIYICIYIHHIQEGFGQEVLLSLCILVHIYMCILRLSPTHKGMGESFSLVIFLNLDTYTRLSMCLNIYTSEPCRHRHG